MAPKKRVCNDNASPKTKERNISGKRQDLALAGLTSEVEHGRRLEMAQFVWDEMLKYNTSCDVCYAIAVTQVKKRDMQYLFHRNNNCVGHVALYTKIEILAATKAMKHDVLKKVATDKKQLEELFKWLTNYSAATLLGVAMMPLVNFIEIAHLQI